MKTEDLQRLKARLEDAEVATPVTPVPPREQSSEQLRARVQAILEAGYRNPAPPPAAAAPRSDAEPAPERRIGPYRIERELGRGGMGVVYLATRSDNQYQKQVAIKLLERSQDSEQRLGHFRRERQMLANLDHPHIARLLDGGTTEDGDPYLVMEYVRGARPIDIYCDENRLTIGQRLKLYLDVCAAVQYAHQHLIVHGDLKPGNVLISRDGQVKLLDFGIARPLFPSLTPDLADRVRPTGPAMTPAYASPEQIRGEPIGTASDVYSLGVLLYELLTGRLPFGGAEVATTEMIRAVLEDQLKPPSAVVGDNGWRMDPASQARRESPWSLRWRLSGDLDAAVMRALASDDRNRYASAEQLGEDLRRHLERRPVVARRQSIPYRGGKFLRRNALVAATVVAAAVFAGAVISLPPEARWAAWGPGTGRGPQPARSEASSMEPRMQAELDQVHRQSRRWQQWSGTVMRDLERRLEAPDRPVELRVLMAEKTAEYLDLLAGQPVGKGAAEGDSFQTANQQELYYGHRRLAEVWTSLALAERGAVHWEKAVTAALSWERAEPGAASLRRVAESCYRLGEAHGLAAKGASGSARQKHWGEALRGYERSLQLEKGLIPPTPGRVELLSKRIEHARRQTGKP